MKGLKMIINPENISRTRSVLMQTAKSSTFSNVNAKKALIVTKIDDMNAFYNQAAGVEKLKHCQGRVNELQELLVAAQLKRREMSCLLHDMRTKGQEVRDRIYKVKRYQEPGQFMELIKEETELIKRERDCYALLNDQEHHEHEVFTAFSNAIRESQDKQLTSLKRTKYISLGLALFGVLASYEYNAWRTKDFTKVMYTINTRRADDVVINIDWIDLQAAIIAFTLCAALLACCCR